MSHTPTTLPEEHPPQSNTPPKNESNDDEEVAERRRIQESLNNMVAEVHELKRLQQELDAEDALFEGKEAHMEDGSENPDPASSQTEAVALISQDTFINASTRYPTPLLQSAPHSTESSHLDSERHSQRQQRDSISPSTKLQGRESSGFAVEGHVGDVTDYGLRGDDGCEGRGVRVGDSVVWDLEVVGVRLGEGGWVLWEGWEWGKGKFGSWGFLRVDGLE